MPVRFAIDRAGQVGADGATHAGSFDITYLSTLPNFIVMAPSDEDELSDCIATSLEINNQPSAFRYPRGEGVGVKIKDKPCVWEMAARLLKEGNKACILAVGTTVQSSLHASELLGSYGLSTTVVD